VCGPDGDAGMVSEALVAGAGSQGRVVKDGSFKCSLNHAVSGSRLLRLRGWARVAQRRVAANGS
jgi:acyl-CoA thioesterase